MTHTSGKRGFCGLKVCSHANDSHEIEECRAKRCRIQWKRCNVAPDCAGVELRICKTCPNHPGAGPSHWENGSNKIVARNYMNEDPEDEKKSRKPQKSTQSNPADAKPTKSK